MGKDPRAKKLEVRQEAQRQALATFESVAREWHAHAAGELENRLAGFETEVNKALDVIEQSRTMDDRNAWVHVLNLAAMFAVRNPRMRDGMEHFQAQIAKVTMSMVLSSREMYESQMKQARAGGHIARQSKATYEEMREFFERDEYTIKVSNASHIVNEFGVFEDVLRTLVARKWALCIAPADSGGFITSDHPICLMSSDGSPSELRRPVGHGLMETTVLFPISRDLAAMGTFENEDQVVALSHEGVAAMNGFGLHQLSHHHNKQQWGLLVDPKGIHPALREKIRVRFNLPAPLGTGDLTT